ncbi:MAG: hypothetical protein HYZ13_13520 [Acidobacteria bacterium]|nr:hypothetical protein [Acidobacteriota bacterium]
MLLLTLAVGLLLRLVEARLAMAEQRGLIPIRAAGKSVRNDKGFWETVGTYVEPQTHTTFTHGLWPNPLAQARAERHRELGAELRPG